MEFIVELLKEKRCESNYVACIIQKKRCFLQGSIHWC